MGYLHTSMDGDSFVSDLRLCGSLFKFFASDEYDETTAGFEDAMKNVPDEFRSPFWWGILRTNQNVVKAHRFGRPIPDVSHMDSIRPEGKALPGKLSEFGN